jgi:hypothetical protein
VAVDIPYYTKVGKYLEMNYCLNASELRMEFYLEILKDLRKSGNSFFKVYIGSNYLVAAKLSYIAEFSDLTFKAFLLVILNDMLTATVLCLV